MTMTVGLVAVTLTGCDSLPFGGGDSTGTSDSMIVEVEVTSDSASATGVRVEVDARNDPERVETTDMPLPYAETFEVSLDTPFPLTGTSVEAIADAGASWISCQITMDGEIVAEERAEGAGATVFCAKKLRIGPQ
ncbi:hypothetical protein BJI47_01055 [Rhodococcus sp. 1168]|nr:hypothetical protein BJI47_01055 [Rhodococcus sp. 1168]